MERDITMFAMTLSLSKCRENVDNVAIGLHPHDVARENVANLCHRLAINQQPLLRLGKKRSSPIPSCSLSYMQLYHKQHNGM